MEYFLPLISIVTISYNAVNLIEKTILSVVEQDTADFEYIVIDGGSTDGTVEVIRKYENAISYWVSESDKGIFDAMNKALSVAKGDWVIFMNSGDCFYNNHVLSEIAIYMKDEETELIYGDVNLFSGKRNCIFKQRVSGININLNSVCHQTVFIRRKLHPYFDVRYKLTADHDIIFDFIKRGQYIHANIVIAKVLLGGVSHDVIKTSLEKLLISYRKGTFMDLLLSPLCNIYQVIKYFVKKLLISALPIELFNKMSRMKSKMESNF